MVPRLPSLWTLGCSILTLLAAGACSSEPASPNEETNEDVENSGEEVVMLEVPTIESPEEVKWWLDLDGLDGLDGMGGMGGMGAESPLDAAECKASRWAGLFCIAEERIDAQGHASSELTSCVCLPTWWQEPGKCEFTCPDIDRELICLSDPEAWGGAHVCGKAGVVWKPE